MFSCVHIKHNMFVRTKKIHVVVVAQGTVNRVKKRTKKCDARAAEKGAKNVDRRPLYIVDFLMNLLSKLANRVNEVFSQERL